MCIRDRDRAALEAEVGDLDGFAALATSIQHNAKGAALLTALEIAFKKAADLGAARKAIIFTESRRTQSYLLRLLADSPFAEGLVLFNGTNNDDRSKAIYAAWLLQHEGTDRVTGSRSADMRSALVDYFRDRGRIMIATEAGAEGINLQFCALVVNYDLPWNPQRIEQRIGRCHRYGQRHDVVVVNFLNRKNEADRRVFELLSEKFQLFEGVFGASDEVLGAIESGIDFEKRIAAIYQRCRKAEEIQDAFDHLQREIGTEIDEAMTRTRRQLLEHFDDEVREKLRVRDADSRASLNRFERVLMDLTQHELRDCADFLTDSSFRLRTCPFAVDVPGGLYELPRRSGEAHLYRLTHPLAEAVVRRAKSRELAPCAIQFDYGAHEGKVSVLEPFVGAAGWLSLSALTVEALDQAEDHLVFSAVTTEGQPLDDEVCRRLFTLPGRAVAVTGSNRPATLDSITRERQSAIARGISERNAHFFEAEAAKLDAWADDMKAGLEREIKDLDRSIREARRVATAAGTLEEKLSGQKQVRALESQRNQKRRSLFDAQDDLERRRDELIASVEAKLRQALDLRELFAIEWRLS